MSFRILKLKALPASAADGILVEPIPFISMQNSTPLQNPSEHGKTIKLPSDSDLSLTAMRKQALFSLLILTITKLYVQKSAFHISVTSKLVKMPMRFRLGTLKMSTRLLSTNGMTFLDEWKLKVQTKISNAISIPRSTVSFCSHLTTQEKILFGFRTNLILAITMPFGTLIAAHTPLSTSSPHLWELKW